jgi:hypothetical protein
VSVSRHMGLFAVSRLAARNGIRVRLRTAAPQGLSALVWLPGTLTSRQPGTAAGPHSRVTPVIISGQSVSSGLRTPIRRSGGRHRLGLIAATGGQPALAGAGRGPQGTGPQSAWFAAKNPSGREVDALNGAAAQDGPVARDGATAQNGYAAAQYAAAQYEGARYEPAQYEPAQYEPTPYEGAQYEPAAVWQGGVPAVPNWRFMPAPDVPVQREETTAGLPRRIPRANAFPGAARTDAPPSGGHAGPDDPADGYPSLAGQRAWAPAWGSEDSDAPVFGAPTGPRQAREPRRRSPEAARSRLAGFQLGSRDAAQAGRTSSWTSSAGEEPSR